MGEEDINEDKDKIIEEADLKEKKVEEDLNEETDDTLNEEQTKYMKFFQKKLKAKGVNSPSELSKEEKKKFFDMIDKEWEAENEED